MLPDGNGHKNGNRLSNLSTLFIHYRLLDHEGSCSTDGTVTQSLGGIIDFKTCVEVFFCVKCENPFPSMDDLQQHKALLNKRKPFDIVLSEGRRFCLLSLVYLPATHPGPRTATSASWEKNPILLARDLSWVFPLKNTIGAAGFLGILSNVSISLNLFYLILSRSLR